MHLTGCLAASAIAILVLYAVFPVSRAWSRRHMYSPNHFVHRMSYIICTCMFLWFVSVLLMANDAGKRTEIIGKL